MKKELNFFKIGNSFGGNQSWFRDPIMKIGGCAAAAACDTCLNLELNHNKMGLYPYAPTSLSKEDYISFSTLMKPYLRPRIGGITKLKIFVKGFEKYLKERGHENIKASAFEGNRQWINAADAIRNQIERGVTIPFLLLRHKNSKFRFYTWHWFLIVGYEEIENEFYVKTATYGNFHWVSLQELWNTGYKHKGGMIIIE